LVPEQDCSLPVPQLPMRFLEEPLIKMDNAVD
jgi:hypothetical protein